MGADKKGKQELSPALLSMAELYADLPPQARQIGEFQHLTNPSQKVTAIGKLLSQHHSNHRKNFFHPNKVTIFDSSGIALQDISAAQQIYQAVYQSGNIQRIKF